MHQYSRPHGLTSAKNRHHCYFATRLLASQSPYYIMKILEGPSFSENSIIERLISRRVKLAKKNHDRHIIHNYCIGSKKNSSENREEDDQDTVSIYSLMPPRRTWVTLTSKERSSHLKNNGEEFWFPLDSLKQNEKKLRLTIIRDMHIFPYPDYIRKLKDFISNVKSRVNAPSFELSDPRIIPKKKEMKPGANEKEMRPICLFSLEDNIILQEVNRLLTEKFDLLFTNYSYAFRYKNSNGEIPTHHDTIKEIIQYQQAHKNEHIFVAECDLKKFFDTINHTVIKRAFYNALSDHRVNLTCLESKIAEKVFIAYLDVYDFQKCVNPLDANLEYKEKHRCIGYKYKWISENDLQIYDNHKLVHIGVPQGGALSGLIANLVLNEVDIHISNLRDKSLLYLRYCDDMIMMHTDIDLLKTAFTTYQEKVKGNKLFIHDPVSIDTYSKDFYGDKSKNPYIWGDCNNANGNVPWVSFVGYQIGYKGEIRVRKSSIKNEIKKQQKVVSAVIKEIETNKNSTINKDRIIHSVAHRLRGMSIGRISIFHPRTDNTMCWTNGFRNLNYNRFSKKQMSDLDHYRLKAMGRLYFYLKKMKEKDPTKEKESFEEVKENDRKKPKRKKNPVLYYGKPYSYYGWLEQKQISEESPE